MKKALFLVLTLACWAGMVSHSAAQDMGVVKNLASRAEAIDRGLGGYSKTQLDVSEVVSNAGYSKLVTYTDGDGKLFKAVNEQPEEGGGLMSESFYYDARGQFVVALVATHSFGEDGTHFYNDDTYYFHDKQLLATNHRDGEFPHGQKFDGSKLRRSLIPAGETDAPKRESYEYHLRKAQTVGRLVKAFAGREVPAHAMLESISPDGRYVVKWAREDDERADFDLLDLKTGEMIGHVTDGLQPGGSNADYWARWSDDSKWLVFGWDARWTTMAADLFAVSPGKMKRVGDLNAMVGKLTLGHLVEHEHPYADGADSVHGFLKVLSVEIDRSVHLVLSTQGKVEGPENNFNTEMTVKLGVDGSGSALSSGLRILGPGEEPSREADNWGLSEPSPKLVDVVATKLFTITSERIGAIDGGTAFNLKAVRKLFPDQRVVAGRESFEEGGEQPVIHVLADEVAVLTLVPVPDAAELGYVYTTSGRVTTQLGFAVGDQFSEVFESVPEHASYEGISGDVLTEAPGIPNVLFRFRPDEGDLGGNGLLRYNELKGWKLELIEWSPARG